MSTIKDKIKAARLPERSLPVCLDGALVAEIEAAERELEQLRRRPVRDSLDGGGELREVAERIEALRGQMQDSVVEFRMRAMGRVRWAAFLEEHPPRKDDAGTVLEADRALGVNAETFWVALVRESTISPELDDEDWTALLGDEHTDGALTNKQYDQLTSVAWTLNRGDVDVPFSLAASRILNSAPE